MATMRAVVCPKVPIPPSGLVYTTSHPKPSPESGKVLIRVHAYGLNRSELFTRQGLSPGIQFPRVLGIECVGVVEDGGGGKWKKGDVVAALMGGMGRQFDGGYAEYTLVPHTACSPPVTLPKGMGWAEFAAVPETFMTAWGTLAMSLKLQKSDTLLIRGGTTSVGLACATLAKSSLFGCAAVISTTRSERKISKVKAAGVDIVIKDNDKIGQEVKKVTGGKGATKAVELVGGNVLADTAAGLSDDGVVSMVGCVSGVWTCENFDPMMTLAPSKHLTLFSSHYVDISTAPLQQILDLIGEGKLELNLDKVFSMQDTGEAQEYMEASGAAGKVVCVVDE